MNTAMVQLPSIDQCREMFAQYQMLPNIIDHSEKVMQVASIINNHLPSSCGINKELCIVAALLHDITKTDGLKSGEPHAESGGRLLRSIGYPEVADVVAQHVRLKHFAPDEPLNEAEIVFYADKRVKHDVFVSVEERIIDLLERYGITEAQRNRILRMKDTVIDIEVKLERYLDIPLDDLFLEL